MTSFDFICLLGHILQFGYLDAKNRVAPSQPNGGRTCVCRICQECNSCKSADGERLSVIDPIYHLGPTELIFETDGEIAGACVKVSLNVEKFIDEVYTLERMLCVWENEFPVLSDLSTWEVPPMTFELSQTKGYVGNRKVVHNYSESITK
ncbi:hypothetical protein GOBAR_DD15727 [Gossypium barbadense]|nr:hypothetical protein GOBAR_DD15727 [Gossypium barbadense]